MARIAGVDLPRNKRMEIALTYVYGIGRSAALRICTESQVDPGRKSDDLTDEEGTRIRRVLDASYKVEGDLRRDVAASIKRLVDRMLVIFPFEVPFYEKASVPVTFVGHPLVEMSAPHSTRG